MTDAKKAKAKTKTKKAGQGAQKHLLSRITYLYEAASYLQRASSDNGGGSHPLGRETIDRGCLRTPQDKTLVLGKQDSSCSENLTSTSIHSRGLEQKSTAHLQSSNQSRRLIGHLRAVSLKSQIRLSPEIKQSICKRCDSLLIAGSTSSSEMENKSRGGKKPWADTQVVTCNICGAKKRFPVGAKRQPRRTARSNDIKSNHKPES